MSKMHINDVTEIIDNAPDFAEPPQELKEAGLSQRDALLVICDEAQFWRSDAGDVYATVPIHGHVEHHAIRSREFRNWMLHRLACRFTNNGRPASANDNAVKDARAAVEARCLKDNVRHVAPLRVAAHDGAILIDCGTDDWSHYEVTDAGWSAVPKAPVPIIRSRRTSAFIPPADRGDFRPLRALLSHLDDEAFLLLVAWCVGAMLPTGPYPILILGGEQGSGKTTLVRLIQRIADPTKGDVMQPPRDDRDLIAMAKSNRVLALDNLSKITDELADSLCRLSTGSEIGGRALFSDSDLASFTASRPIVVNGIAELASRGDLADRSIVLRLPPLPRRMTEADWNQAVEAVLPATLAGLLDALAVGLRELDATLTPDVRMADFARFIIAAEPVLPWSPGDFLAAYQSNRNQSAGVLADFDCVACAVREFMNAREEWSGLTSDLYRQLSVPIARNRPSDWPGNARWFGDRLRRCAPALRMIGIELADRRTSDGVTLTIRRVASPATPASQNGSDPDCDHRADSDDANVGSASAH